MPPKDDNIFTTCIELFSLDKKGSANENITFKAYINFSLQDEQFYHKIPDMVIKGIVKSNNFVTNEITIRMNYLNLINFYDLYKKSRTSDDSSFEYNYERYSLIVSPATTKITIVMKVDDKILNVNITRAEYMSMFTVVGHLINNLPGYVINHIQLYDIRTISLYSKKMLGITLSNTPSHVIVNNELPDAPEEKIQESINRLDDAVERRLEKESFDPSEFSNNVKTKIESVQECCQEQVPIIPEKNSLTEEFNSFNNKMNNLNITNNFDEFVTFIDSIKTEWNKTDNLINLIINKFRLNGIEYFENIGQQILTAMNSGIFKYYTDYAIKNPGRQKKMFMYKVDPNSITETLEKLCIFFVKYEIQCLVKNDMNLVCLNETCFAPFWMSYLPYVKQTTIDELNKNNIINEREIKTIESLKGMAQIMMGKFPEYYNDMIGYIKGFIMEQKPEKEINQMEAFEQHL